MPAMISVDTSAILTEQKQFSMPAIVGWNRLEPRPRSVDFERSLKAEIRDALWMLSRQWQLGEFRGEDAGSPVDARLLSGEIKLNRYAASGSLASAFDDSIPLETQVEREAVPDSWQLKIQSSTQFFKLLATLSFAASPITLFRTKYKILIPADPEIQAQLLCNQESTQLFEQASLRSIDGVTLLNDIASGNFETWINSYAETDISTADKTSLLAIGNSLLAWFRRVYNQPATTDGKPWSTPYMEYQFNCSAPSGASQTILKADQYASGHLDWYAFDIDKTETSLTDKPDAAIIDAPETEKLISFIPAPISFGGMPNARYWEMEDRKTDFGAIDANTTDVAKLIVAEFGLIYSNDWFVMPYTMETGTICDIKGMVVTDVFGDRTFIRAAGKGEDDAWQTWRLFNMSVNGTGGEADNRLLLIPAATKTLESEPIEKINLLRDEMANIVWGVEDIITLPSGKPRNGYEAAKELSNYMGNGFTDTNTNLAAAVKYTLGTTVPENWIPFISVHVDGSQRQIQMQRAAMPRINDGSDALIAPRTSILQGDDPWMIHEEEVPRSGAIITKTYQRTRWYNGKVVLWIGRKLTNGRGQGNSGLKFDQLETIDTST